MVSKKGKKEKVGVYKISKVWFIDTNILAHWTLSTSGILESLTKRFGLSDELSKTYRERYTHSVNFIEKIFEEKKKGLNDEFHVSYLSTNEMFSAIKDELNSILLFKKGVPLSRWRDPRNNPAIKEDHYHLIYEKILKSFDILFGNGIIFLIKEQSPEDDSNYWSIYSSLLFLIRGMKTQDATLLTTAILNRADFFVTQDISLMKSAKKSLNREYGMEIIKPTNALQILK